ncbi:MAG: hypothetical protein ACREQH_09630 [Candidatus Binatus sp.]
MVSAEPAGTTVNLNRPIAVELTDKKWKSLMLKGRAIRAVAVVIWVVSMGMCASAGGNQSQVDISGWVWMFSVVLFFVGSYTESYAKRQAWWERG